MLYDEHLRSSTSSEYRGTTCRAGFHSKGVLFPPVAPGFGRASLCEMHGFCQGCGPPDADSFGADHRPFGPSACGRRGCSGCCFCIGVALPVYLEVQILRPPVWKPGMVCSRASLNPWNSKSLQPSHRQFNPHPLTHQKGWVTLAELSNLVEQHIEHVTPEYLRRMEANEDAVVIILPGDVRSHISSTQLAQWADHLSLVSTHLEILSGEARECICDTSVTATVDDVLQKQAAEIEQSAAEYEAKLQARLQRERTAQAGKRKVDTAHVGGCASTRSCIREHCELHAADTTPLRLWLESVLP